MLNQLKYDLLFLFCCYLCRTVHLVACVARVKTPLEQQQLIINEPKFIIIIFKCISSHTLCSCSSTLVIQLLLYSFYTTNGQQIHCGAPSATKPLTLEYLASEYFTINRHVCSLPSSQHLEDPRQFRFLADSCQNLHHFTQNARLLFSPLLSASRNSID